MGAVAFISGTQHIKTIAAPTDSQSHYLTLQNVVTVCRAMGRFVPLAVCLFKGGYVSWVQAVHEFGFNLISASWCCSWKAVEMLNLHQTSNRNPWVSHFITHKTHPQGRCHLVFVSFMWSGKFSYFRFPARKLSPRGSETLQRAFWCEPHACKQCLCRVGRQHHPVLLRYKLYKYGKSSAETWICQFLTQSQAIAQDRFQHITLTLY